ncbi:MAG TPA: hypothetical protein VJS38_19125 [Phenylobacterium sp.]|uniref:CC0125/CC1285 family lipoprotein n=1 Tax=Phenylobacterium sp. TaxID=1871053 RepID=UPI002B47837D|nr:hypothetical protein [Phenylobacterium sp.]HKR90287.1 hypothetical protein [Phenylobacterium sp.]
MKRLLPALAALSLTAASLAGCASTPTVYQAATPSNPVGYSEYRIETDRYRITFQGGSSAAPQQVMDFALLRAADLAIANGYDWFQVSDRSVQPTSSNSSSRVSFGVGGASFGSHSSVGMGVGTGFDLGGGGYGAPLATIEVVMGKGRKPDSVDAYDAHALRQTMGRPA